MPALTRPHETSDADVDAGRRWLVARLQPSEMRLLDRQGFVSYERLPSGATCAKLRFRDAEGRQRVVYLGVKTSLAIQISVYLTGCQSAALRRKTLNHMRRRGRRLLRTARSRLAPHLESDEWHFHGRQLRRRRCAVESPTLFQTAATKGNHMHHPEPTEPFNPEYECACDNPMTTVAESRHDEMRQWAREQGSPFDAAVGFLTADLCDMAAALAEPIKIALRETPQALSAADGLAESLRLYLQLGRQAERYMKLAPRGESGQSQAKIRSFDTYAENPTETDQSPIGSTPK